MYLKSLTLKGFKSFADRAHLVFEPGLTVIVGPNGSGKSNVSDAILWVLGEQSAKQLRGQAMEDVVFAGSSARKPVGVAEVDLVLDNSDHTIPVDFDEVALTRRMYRSGESEYLVNGAPARLLDITDILHDSGLGKDTHSIISQGKLDAILMSRPEERRALIEEAAGISKHKRRREKSVRRLASMDEHLRRALDVQKEVNRQLKPLERQVDRAQRFNDLTARASELRIVLAVDDLRRLQGRWRELEEVEGEANAALEAAETAVGQRQEALDELQALLEEKGRATGDVLEQRRRCQSSVERLGSGVRLLEEKGRNMVARLSELRGSLHRAETRSASCNEELAMATAERDANRTGNADLRKRMDAANERVRAAREARRSAESELSKIDARAQARRRERDAASVALAKARDALESSRVQDGIVSSRLEQLDEASAQSQRDLEAALERSEQAAERLDAARREEAGSKGRLDAARTRIAEAQRADSQARAALSAAEARAAGLEQAAVADENAAPLAARMAADPALKALSTARVSELLDVPAELSGLVEKVLGGALAGFAVPGASELAELGEGAQRLAASSNGVVHLVEATPCEARGAGEDTLPGFALLERLGVKKGYEGAVERMLGDIRVVDDAQAAFAASLRDPARRYVTLQGDVVCLAGTARVGCVDEGVSGVLERRRRLREIQDELPGLRADAREAQDALAAAERELSEARRAHEEDAQLVARLSGEATAAARDLSRLRQADDKALSERARLEAQRSEAQRRAAEAEASVATQEALLAAAEEDIESLAGELGAAQEAFDAARREDRAAHDEANTCQLELARVQERSGSLDARCERLRREAAELAQTLEVSRATARSLEVMTARVEPLHACYAGLLEAARMRADELGALADAAEADSTALRFKIDEARRALSEASERYSRAMGVVGDVKVEKGRLDVQVDAAVKAITTQRGVVLEEALEMPAPQDRAADEAELAELEKALAGIGPVNQVAFEEYERLKARADYIGEQVDDLQHARGDLTKILNVIDRKMRSSFISTFKEVNANFEEIFSMLFPGGNGHLEMTDPEDPASTGIEVVAQPRGKKVTKMSLLSGGERSLTALGLLFAVYTTRTVPFYVLDEVEAALDDSNLDRLLGAIDVLRKRTQLIVISHQRRTMERADVLYGVSMRADGVSRVVSQKLDGHGNVVNA